MPAADALLPDLRHKRLLVVEDETLVAEDLRRDLEALGASVLGPVPSVAAALAMLEDEPSLDGAILDINLGGEVVYPVAGALQTRHVPFVFWSGYAAPPLPRAFDAVPRLQKPASVAEVVHALLRDVATPLPHTPVLADLYMAADGGHLLAPRQGREPLDGDDLAWVGAGAIDWGDWGRRLRVPLRPGELVRVPWRHVAGLRQEMDVLG